MAVKVFTNLFEHFEILTVAIWFVYEVLPVSSAISLSTASIQLDSTVYTWFIVLITGVLRNSGTKYCISHEDTVSSVYTFPGNLKTVLLHLHFDGKTKKGYLGSVLQMATVPHVAFWTSAYQSLCSESQHCCGCLAFTVRSSVMGKTREVQGLGWVVAQGAKSHAAGLSCCMWFKILWSEW